MARSPIEALIDRAAMRCTVCQSTSSCACWTKCECGWSYLTGESCRNLKHPIVRFYQRYNTDNVAKMGEDEWGDWLETVPEDEWQAVLEDRKP